MQVLMTFLYILLFLVFLSVLIIIHELGHLAAAKAFHVYCLEYSIGMGPALFKFKKKNWETQFTLRAIPFGGYVSMYGEGVELPEGVTVDESRSLNGIKPWKRAIVLLAGVTMNAILALVFFFISNCFPQESIDYLNHLNVSEAFVPLGATTLQDGDYIKYEEIHFQDEVAKKERTFYLADNQTIFNDDDTVNYATVFNFEKLTSFKHLDLSEHILFYELKNVPTSLYSKTAITNASDFNDKVVYIANNTPYAERAYKLLCDYGVIQDDYSVENFDANNLDYHPVTGINVTIKSLSIQELAEKVNGGDIAILPSNYALEEWDATYLAYSEDNFMPDFTKHVTPAFEQATIHLTRRVEGKKGGLIDGDIVSVNVKQVDGAVQPFGCSLYYTKIQYNFGQVVKYTFVDFGDCSVLLFKTIGSLFTNASSWGNVGGIIAVGFETTNVLQNFGFGKFLFYWGFISVNLAIFNLLPFPGLDGWQLLVLIVESTTKKKIPEKVKNIVSFIGIGLLLLLMGVVLVKDLIKYVFMGVSLL